MCEDHATVSGQVRRPTASAFGADSAVGRVGIACACAGACLGSERTFCDHLRHPQCTAGPPFVGLLVHVFWTSKRPGDDLFKSIVEKVRRDPNLDAEIYAGMTPARLRNAIASDERVRTKVNEQDLEILTLLIRSQFKTTLLVLAGCIGLVILTVVLFRTDPFRPRPTAVSQVEMASADHRSDGVLVDVFPLLVRWQATGKEQLVSVTLQNAVTGRRTAAKQIISSARSLRFSPTDVRPILSSREHGRSNLIRAVVDTQTDSASSQIEELHVGITVSLLVSGTLITPDGEQANVHHLAATIDDSSDSLPVPYRISAQLVGEYWSGEKFVQILKTEGHEGFVDLQAADRIRWSAGHELKYVGPEDPRKVLTEVQGIPTELPRVSAGETISRRGP